MQFTIKGQVYPVRISSRPLFLDGDSCDAKIDLTHARILISNQLPRHERKRALLHELRHGWVEAHGRATSEEADADDVAEMMDVLMSQYLAEGGDAVLEALNPDPEKRQGVPRMFGGPLSQVRADCGRCGAGVAVGSIGNDPPRFSDDGNVWLMDRGMLCPACDSVTAWTEMCSQEGMPLGAIVAHPKPRVLSGKAAGEWIAAHADDCRCCV